MRALVGRAGWALPMFSSCWLGVAPRWPRARRARRSRAWGWAAAAVARSAIPTAGALGSANAPRRFQGRWPGQRPSRRPPSPTCRRLRLRSTQTPYRSQRRRRLQRRRSPLLGPHLTGPSPWCPRSRDPLQPKPKGQTETAHPSSIHSTDLRPQDRTTDRPPTTRAWSPRSVPTVTSGILRTRPITLIVNPFLTQQRTHLGKGQDCDRTLRPHRTFRSVGLRAKRRRAGFQLQLWLRRYDRNQCQLGRGHLDGELRHDHEHDRWLCW